MSGKKDKFKTGMHIEKANFSNQVKSKMSTMNTHIQMLTKSYQRQSRDFVQHFENAVASNISIDALKTLIDYADLVFRNSDALFNKAKLSADVQVAIDNLYAYSIVNPQRQLNNLLSTVHKNHIPTNITCPHNYLVLLNKEQIDENDVKKYYSTIQSNALFEENEFVVFSLSKYPTLFVKDEQPPIQQPMPVGPYPPYPYPPTPGQYPPYPPYPQPVQPGTPGQNESTNPLYQPPPFDPNPYMETGGHIPMYRLQQPTMPPPEFPQYPQVPPTDKQ